MDSDTITDDPGSASSEPAPGSALAPGARLGSYGITRLLGRGGMGEVYEAVDERLGRVVALKRVSGSRGADAEARARFWREARALAALRHPGVVVVYEIGEDQGELFLVMELVRGRSLAELGRAPWPARAALTVAIAAAEALGAAHAEGITHRDVKPGNVLLDEAGAVRVVDFGLARGPLDSLEGLTQPGALLGTPAYMSPELLGGKSVGPPADVFALGALLYRLLTGTQPFARESAEATALAIAGAVHEPLSARRPDLPAGLTGLVTRSLGRAPERRPADGAALAEALRPWLLAVGGSMAPGELAALARRRQSELDEQASELAPPYATMGAPSPPRAGWRWPPVAGLVVAAAAAAAFVALGGSPEPGGDPPASDLRAASVAGAAISATARAPAPPSDVPTPSPERGPALLPPRPAVAVLGFTSHGEADHALSEVAADVLRVRLDEHPAALLSLSTELLEARLPDGRRVEPTLPPDALVRPGRGPGHVDVALRGQLDVLAPGALRLRAELVHTASGAILGELEATAGDVVAAAEDLARATLASLGVPDARPRARLSPSPEAWIAWRAARRAAHRADLGAAEEALRWARRLDPAFGLTRLQGLLLHRGQGRHEELLAEADALRAEPDALPPREARIAAAVADLARGRTRDALRSLYEVTETWPYDLDAAQLLMAIRAKDDGYHDFDEVEALARRLLALAPRLEVAASRLIRTLAARGRAAEAERAILALGVPRDDPDFGDVFAEVDLHVGRFAEAAAGFERALGRDPGNAYAEHMAFIAHLLGGDCARAAGAALDRIERVATRGRDSLLDWTYSVAAQALLCAERWEPLAALRERWAAHGASGAMQSFDLGERVALLRAADAPREEARASVAALEVRWRALLDDPGTPREAWPTLVGLLARVGEDLDALRDWRARAQALALDPEATAAQRAGWRQLACQLGARVTLRKAVDPDFALARYGECILPLEEVRSEGHMAARIAGLLARAEAARDLGAGDVARDDWLAVRGAGYSRLYVTDLWLIAARRLEASR